MSTQIKTGYKLTEVGVIPEDWELAELSTVCMTSSGTTPARSLADRYYRNGTVNWVKTLDLNNSEIANTDELVTQTALEETCLRVYPKGTVLVAMYGGFNQIGRTGLLQIPAAVNQAITAIQTKAILHPGYLLATLNYRVDYWRSVASSSRKDPNITSQDVRSFKISFPPINEQRDIAISLSDIDALISGLDKLIAKKRDIKQATMQQLLTGQKRLPGFSGEWVVVKAGDVGRFRGGSGFPTKYQGAKSGLYPFYKVSDMNNDGNEIFMRSANNYVDEARRKLMGAPIFPAGSIIFAKVGAAIFLERKKILSRESCLDNNMAAYIFDSARAHTGFIHYSFLNMTLGDLVSTTALPSLSGRTLSAIELNLPSLAEQAAIATILSNMDSELTTLEIRRDKARQLKQGMMQELLTGRIRLSQSSQEAKLC
jgi:type I restriction enzyme S subunit